MKLPIRWILSTIVLLSLVASSGTVTGADVGGQRSDLELHLNGNQSTLLATDAYTVDVDCDFDDNDNLTECEFSAVAPRDASDVRRLTVPASLLCAEVLDGDFVRVELEDGQGGYASEEDEDELGLELRGRVTTGGTATYWVSTVGRMVPAEGPALRCDQAADDQPSPRMTATVTTPGPTVEAVATAETPATTANERATGKETPVTTTQDSSTGTLVVATLSCTNVPEDRSTFDWFGECTPGAGPLGFNIDHVYDTGMGERAVGTNGNTGEAVFEDVPAGTYKLRPGRGEPFWCHAISDSVDADGHVVIENGSDVTVWAFYCQPGTS